MRIRELIFAYGPWDATALAFVAYAFFLVAALYVIRRNNRQALRFTLWAWVAAILAGGSRAASAMTYLCCGPVWLEIIDMHRSICCGIFIGACCTAVLFGLASIRATESNSRLQYSGLMVVSMLLASVILGIMALAFSTEAIWGITL